MDPHAIVGPPGRRAGDLGSAGATSLSRHHVTSDNAQVEGHITIICAAHAGFVPGCWWRTTST